MLGKGIWKSMVEIARSRVEEMCVSVSRMMMRKEWVSRPRVGKLMLSRVWKRLVVMMKKTGVGVMSVSRESMMVMAKRVPKEDEMYKVLKEIARVTMWLRVSVREGVVMKEMVSKRKVSVEVLVMWEEWVSRSRVEKLKEMVNKVPRGMIMLPMGWERVVVMNMSGVGVMSVSRVSMMMSRHKVGSMKEMLSVGKVNKRVVVRYKAGMGMMAMSVVMSMSKVNKVHRVVARRRMLMCVTKVAGVVMTKEWQGEMSMHEVPRMKLTVGMMFSARLWERVVLMSRPTA